MSRTTGNLSSQSQEAARLLFNWLCLRDDPAGKSCDAVIGFGHFDLSIPRQCDDLHRRGLARHVIFTGGTGAGTADLGRPEADAFRSELEKSPPLPGPVSRPIVENRSTNTGENIRFTRDLLEAKYPELSFGRGIQSVLLVANACRQRRVWLTWRRLLPSIPAFNHPPPGGYEDQQRLYAGKGLDITAQLVGEVERIRDYPARGWIVATPIPASVIDAMTVLRAPNPL